MIDNIIAEIIVDRVKAGGRNGLLAAYLDLVGCGIDGDEAIAALQGFVDAVIARSKDK